MQKTKLGISVGLLGAALFFTCFYGGYTTVIILAGYILLFEDNAWLKRSTIKGVSLMFGFALLSSLINLLPNAISVINSICNLFDGSFYIIFISKIVNACESIISLAEKVIFIVLGLKAFNQGTIAIPFIDSLVNKYMD